MRWFDLLEARLPLIKGDLPRLRGSYAAFVITMNPADFLRLTVTGNDLERIQSRSFPNDLDTFKNAHGGNDENFGRYSMPFLMITWPSGKITGHEGRHRANMILKQGGNVFPVAIFMKTANEYEITYERWDPNTDETTSQSETFTDYTEAERRVKYLKSWNKMRRDAYGSDEEDKFEDVLYFTVRMNHLRGNTIKGSPNYENPNDPWDRKAFTTEDMPKQLIGQYDSSVVVTDFKVGLVKGYKHFR